MDSAFTLSVRSDGIAALVFDLPGSPVNLMSVSVLIELVDRLESLSEREDIERLVLLSGKRTGFVAGANLEEILHVDESQLAADVARLGQRATSTWEALPYSTIAAIDGASMGGGTELALAADYIVVSDRPGLRIGLPEVKIGIIPGWGGCVRLPRRVGIAKALDMIVTGRDVDGKAALEIGLADQLVPSSQFRRGVLDFVGSIPAEKPPRPDTRSSWLERNAAARNLIYRQTRKRVLETTGGRYPAPLRAIEVVRLGIEKSPLAAFEAEVRAIRELATSMVCKNLIRVFRLTESARRRPTATLPRGQGQSEPGRPSLRSIGILGSGAMGSSVAHEIAGRANLPVRLLDRDRSALEEAMSASARAFSTRVSRGSLTPQEAERRQALIRPAMGLEGLGRCDLLIENVYENLELKRQVLEAVAEHLPESAVLATNTSSLTVGQIGEGKDLAERLVGMHFFRPVHRMRLVEVVRGKDTTDRALETAIDFVHQLRKIPILVGDSPGFLINRILYFYLVEALWLLHEGHSVAEIDHTMEVWGMPMGPFAVLDEIGIDVAVEVARRLGESFGRRLPLPPWIDIQVEVGSLGRKTGQGFYLYDEGRRRGPDPDLADRLEIQLFPEISRSREPLDRLTLRMVDEAASCLAEGIVDSPQRLDLAMILGTGFPAFRGGLLRWADQIGPREILETLERVTAGCGERFRPSEALREIAEIGAFEAP